MAKADIDSFKKARANPVYITPVVRHEYRDDDSSSDDLPEGDDEYKPSGVKKQKLQRKKRRIYLVFIKITLDIFCDHCFYSIKTRTNFCGHWFR